MNYWIFQSVPARYDLRDADNLHDGMQGWWHATRYRTRMTKGDLVYFWMGGEAPIRGIYGWGNISSEPYEKEGGYRVGIRVARRLPNHITIGDIQRNLQLRNLMILNLAIGSNFLINKGEAAAIRDMMPAGFQPEVPQNV